MLSDPARTSTTKYSYTFKGWTPTVASVTADAVYKAVFDSTVRSYTITFVNGSDTLQSSTINYGVTPSYKGEIPTKGSTAQYTYSFKGWSPSISYVSRNATYQAVFDSTKATGMTDRHFTNLEMSVRVVSRNIQISTARIGAAYALFDMQGKVLLQGRVQAANFEIPVMRAGSYLLKIESTTQRVSVR